MASIKDIKANIKVDTTDFIKSLRQLKGIIKMDNVRILKGWTKDERKELEKAKDNGYLSAMTLIDAIGDDYDDCYALSEKYCREDPNDNDQMAKDIADFYTGKAKFPEQKYYIKMPKVNYPYLIRDMGGKFDHAQSPDVLSSGENSFTEDEIIDIDPRYIAFAVPVEDDDE